MSEDPLVVQHVSHMHMYMYTRHLLLPCSPFLADEAIKKVIQFALSIRNLYNKT